jgi:hypothetical protein
MPARELPVSARQNHRQTKPEDGRLKKTYDLPKTPYPAPEFNLRKIALLLLNAG